MLLLLDNFDSFTWNLVDYFGQLGLPCDVVRNDAPLASIDFKGYQGVVLSPGPGRPERAGTLMPLIAQVLCQLPILGICLGHQAIGQYFGAKLVKAQKPMHGKISRLVTADPLMFGEPEGQLQVVRYHSLLLTNLPAPLLPTAHTAAGELMAFRHSTLPVWGVQYHPEAILTEGGLALLGRWAECAGIAPALRKPA